MFFGGVFLWGLGFIELGLSCLGIGVFERGGIIFGIIFEILYNFEFI